MDHRRDGSRAGRSLSPSWVAAQAIAIAPSADDDPPLTVPLLTKPPPPRSTTRAAARSSRPTLADGAAHGEEVRLGDGHVLEVSLDENFNVVGESADDDGSNDQEESGND